MAAVWLAYGLSAGAGHAAQKIDGADIFGHFRTCVRIMVEGQGRDALGKPFQSVVAGDFVHDTFVLDDANAERVIIALTTERDNVVVSCAVMASQLRSAPTSDTAAIAEAQRLGEVWTQERQAEGWPASAIWPERVFDLCVDGRTVRVLVEESRSAYAFGAKASVAKKGEACVGS